MPEAQPARLVPFCPDEVLPSSLYQSFVFGDASYALADLPRGAGGTTALLQAALRHAEDPRYRALILSFNQTPHLYMKKWLEGCSSARGSWATGCIELLGGGRIEFGSLLHSPHMGKGFVVDLDRYRGMMLDFLGLDLGGGPSGAGTASGSPLVDSDLEYMQSLLLHGKVLIPGRMRVVRSNCTSSVAPPVPDMGEIQSMYRRVEA